MIDHLRCFTDPNVQPAFDYVNLPFLPRTGIQADGNQKFLTRSLFLETAKPDQEENALWCLSEHEVYAHGRWYPSAWMAYIYSTDEYDALRKICGNVRQWDRIKQMTFPKVFALILEDWQAEQAYVQKASIRETLLKGALSGMPGYTTAAKMVLQMIDGKGKAGRPKKEKEPAQEPAKPGVDEDHRRLFGEKG